jgi:excisionase family DNA binding protein
MTPAAEARIRAALAELGDAIVAALDGPPATPDRLLSVDEASTALGLGRTALYGEVQAGRLRSITVGRRRLIPAAAVAEFIAQRRATAAGGSESPQPFVERRGHAPRAA